MDQPERVGKGLLYRASGLKSTASANRELDPNKLKRRAFSAAFFLACLASIELGEVVLGKIFGGKPDCRITKPKDTDPHRTAKTSNA
jgi:hypothetical protein